MGLKWEPLYTFALGSEEKPSQASSNGVESDWSIQDRPFRAHTTPEYTGIRMTLTVYIQSSKHPPLGQPVKTKINSYRLYKNDLNLS